MLIFTVVVGGLKSEARRVVHAPRYVAGKFGPQTPWIMSPSLKSYGLKCLALMDLENAGMMGSVQD